MLYVSVNVFFTNKNTAPRSETVVGISFGETLRKYRMEKGISQQELAQKMFVDRSSVTRWESGTRLPDAVMISCIADCLDLDVSLLLKPAGYENEKINVIVVDDEEIILSGEIDVLRDVMPEACISGFQKGSDALSYAKRERVDIAFLDVMMGSTRTGLDLCRELLEINPLTNVIYLTAYADYALDAWKTGASGFLLKPIAAEDVRTQFSLLRHAIRGG